MKHKVIITILAIIFTFGGATAGEIRITERKDGSVIIEAKIEDIGELAGDYLKTISEFGVAIGKAFGASEKIDYSKAHVIKGKFQVSVARPDGSVGLYPVRGKIYAFDKQKTFNETATTFTLEGVILFYHKEKLMGEMGTISLIKS